MSDPVLSFNERRRFKHRVQKVLRLPTSKGSIKDGNKKVAGPVFEKIEYQVPAKEKLLMAGGALLLGALIFTAGLRLYSNYKHNQDVKKLGGVKHTSQIATASQEENRYKKVDDQNLKAGDIESYQIAKLSLVNSYLLQKDFNNADRLLDQIKKNVPNDKLQSSYFVYKLQIDQKNKDTNAQKEDLTSLVTISRSHQQNLQADSYQQQLDKLNGVKKSTSAPAANSNVPQAGT